MKKLILIILLLFISTTAYADFSLPSSRVVTWAGNVGVSGGIPQDRTQCGSTITSTGDTTNRTTTIQNALNACGSGQYVLLGPGQFTISALYMKSNVTLRGSGMGVTLINPTGPEFLQFGPYGVAFGTSVGITAGLSKGSTEITTSGNHGWSPGDHIVIDQLNNASGDPPITNVGDGGSSTMGGRANGTRVLQQVVKLVAPTSGSTATLEIPLYTTFDGAYTPQGTKVTMSVENAGVESMTFNSSYVYSFTIFNSSNCWLYDVELNGMHESGFAIYLSNSYRTTISHCKFHQSTGANTSDNYIITSSGTGSAYLIENNLIYKATNPLNFQGGASGCVVAYNYITDVSQTAYPTANRYGLGQHGSHHFQNLFEGNVVEGAFFSSDNYWGSNSHNTLFRNRIIMDYAKNDMTVTLGVDVHQTYFNIIGNYLGADETAYETASIPYGGSDYIYFTGTGSSTTMLRHGNWDGYNDTQLWCDTAGEPGCQGGSTEHALPNSLYLTAKPDWFGSVTWPPINPTIPSVADIPAQVFYDTGSWPEAEEEPPEPPPAQHTGGIFGGCVFQ